MRKKSREIVLLMAFCLSVVVTFSQERVTTIGIQFRPIVLEGLINDKPVETQSSRFNFKTSLVGGYSAGLIVRHGFTDYFAIESGINFVRRSYEIKIDSLSGPSMSTQRFNFIGYEIPVKGLFYVRMSDKIFMNVGGGVRLTGFPSNVTGDDEKWQFFGERKGLVGIGATASLGWEYRTDESGIIYLGMDIHQQLSDIVTLAIGDRNYINATGQNLGGSYVSLDLRYYFHEKPRLKKLKKKKKK